MPRKRAKKTRIIVQADEETVRELYLRGEGVSNLSWEKGVELKHSGDGEWLFETDEPFSTGAFKVLIDDETFEIGESHPLYPGASIRINPRFPG